MSRYIKSLHDSMVKSCRHLLNTKERPSVTNETDEISILAEKDALDLDANCHFTDSLHLKGVEIQHYATHTLHPGDATYNSPLLAGWWSFPESPAGLGL